MKVVYILKKDIWESKMSRIRFHTIDAIKEYLEKNDLGTLIVTGPGWKGWNSNINCSDNIQNVCGYDPDVVIAYKPSDIKGFSAIDSIKCLRYNEMFDENYTANEILKNRINLVVCHHYNDYEKWLNKVSAKPPYPFDFIWIPHSVNTGIFKDFGTHDKYDVVLMGATDVKTILGEHYPLRSRVKRLLPKLPSDVSWKIHEHVGGIHSDSFKDKYMKDFSRKLNEAKMLITCSGKTKSRFGKYLEASACGTGVVADVYEDHPDDVFELKKFLIEINNDMSDDEIINKIVHYARNERDLDEKISAGKKYMENYSTIKYAERFFKSVSKFLDENKA